MHLKPVVILSTADYQSPVWTNKQHIASRLAYHTTVHYIDSLGLRSPTLSLSDLRRVTTRLTNSAPTEPRAGAETSHEPTVHKPLVVPFHRFKTVRAVNSQLIARFAERFLPHDGYVLWTFSPLTYGLENRASSVVYHSVDLLHTLPGVPSKTLVQAEMELTRRADAVVASSSGVATHLQSLGRHDVHLWPNVADVSLFRPSEAQPARRARALFAGNLTPTKIDVDLLLQLADRGVELALAGPVGIDGTDTRGALRKLLGHPMVDYLGNLSQNELADAAQASMVGLIPYRLNAYTSGVFPMKLYEYLAAGLSVVSTPLPSLAQLREHGLETKSGPDFVSAVEMSVRNFEEEGAAQRTAAAVGHSWEDRLGDVLRLLRLTETHSSEEGGRE